MFAGSLGTSLASRGIWEACRILTSRIWSWRFSQLFGPDALTGNFFLVPGALIPPRVQDEQGNPSPFVFGKSGSPGIAFSTSLAVPYCELRATKYLSDTIAANGRAAKLAPDEDVRTRQDLSFVALGLLSNLKSVDLIRNTANQLVDYKDGAFVSRLSGRRLVRPSAGSDFGLILKVNPANLPEKPWICCAGYGEWGTSGAAWFSCPQMETDST